MKPKPFTVHDTKCSKLTNWIEISYLELFNHLEEEKKQGHHVQQEEICSICQCELYEDIHTAKKSEAEAEQ